MTIGPDFADVLAGAQANEPWAFSRLWHDLSATVSGYLRLQGAREPEDLTSQVFLEVFRDLYRFRGAEPNFRSWVFTIAHHRLLDERRRAARRPANEPFDPDLHDRIHPAAEDDLLAHLTDRRVTDSLEQLTDDQRDVLLLRIVGELSVEETATTLRKSPDAVKKLQRRGLGALRRMPKIQAVAVQAVAR